MVAPAPAAPRFLGVLGIALMLGAFASARSVSEAWHYGTESRAREIELAQADNLIWSVAKQRSGNQLPAAVPPMAEKARTGLSDMVLKRRPVLEALALTNALLCALLAAFAMSAMRLRPTGRAWLVQAAIAGIAFGVLQAVCRALIQLERMGILLPCLQAISPSDDPATFRIAPAVLEAMAGAVKITFLIYLVIVMRRPAVRAMYRTEAR